MFKQWIYHATEEPKVINSNQFEKYESEGWADTPAIFTKIDTFGADKDDPTQGQALGESIQGVVDALNGSLNLGKMKLKALQAYAKEHTDIDPAGLKKSEIIELVEEYLKP